MVSGEWMQSAPQNNARKPIIGTNDIRLSSDQSAFDLDLLRFATQPHSLLLFRLFDRWVINTQRIGEIRQMILLLRNDLSQDFAQCKFTHRFRLADSLPVIDDCLLFVIQVESQHIHRLF